jgi:iron complex outermembrane receptor protein
MDFRRVIRRSLLAALLSGTAPTLAAVRHSTVPTDANIETVRVTAMLRSEELKNVPIDVTAVSSAQIRERHLLNANQIAAYVPGLNISSDSIGRSFMEIRGVGTTLLDTVQPGVGIFVDGIYEPVTSYLSLPLLNVERVEVLKGPQGTLFGNDTLGGAINIITKPPSNHFEGSLNATYAGPDNYNTEALSLSGPLIDGVLQGRISLAHHSDEGFETNALVGGHANPLHQDSANGTLRWEAARNVLVTFNTYYDRVHGGVYPYQSTSGPHAYTDIAHLNQNNLGTYTYSGANLKGEFTLPAIATKVTAITAYDHRDARGSLDADYEPVDLFRATASNTLSTTTGELRFDTHWSKAFSTLIGVFDDTQRYDSAGVTTLVPLSLAVPSYQKIGTDVFAVYGTVFWTISKTVEITAGLRWDHQHIAQTGSAAVPSLSSNELEPRVTLTKHWSQNWMTYASVARGFRGGGINPPFSPNPVFRGDSVWTYETGSKYGSPDGRFSLNSAVFFNDYFNFIGQNSLAPATPPGIGFIGINLNSGHVQSYGLELQSDIRITDPWTLEAGATYLHSRIVNGQEYQQTTGMGLPSNRILLLPDWNFNISSDYTIGLKDGSALDFNAGIVAKGDRKGSSLTPGYAPTLSAYYLVNGGVTWRHNQWDLQLWVKNLFDKKYWNVYLDKSVLGAAGLGAFATDLGLIGNGRRIGVTATYRF